VYFEVDIAGMLWAGQVAPTWRLVW